VHEGQQKGGKPDAMARYFESQTVLMAQTITTVANMNIGPMFNVQWPSVPKTSLVQ